MKLYPRTPRIEYILPPARDNSRKITPCAGGSIPRLHCIFYCISPLPIWKPPPPPRSPALDPAGSQRKSVCKSYRETSLNPFQTETGLLGSPLPSPILGGAREHRTGHDQEPVENRKRKPGQASLYAIETARRKAHSSLYTQWLRSLVHTALWKFQPRGFIKSFGPFCLVNDET